MANARWSDTGTRPDWLDRENLNRNVIATKKGWTLRRNYTNGFSQSIQRDETLVAIGDLANNVGTPTVTEVFTANNSGGTIFRAGFRGNIAVVFDEGLLRRHANGPSGWKLTVANTASGNSVLAIANTTIALANNTLYFNFIPAVKGTYKVQAQTLANSTNYLRGETNNENVSRTISSSVSNTLGTFTVWGTPVIKAVTLANATGGSTYRTSTTNYLTVRWDDDLDGNVAMLRMTVANTAAGNSVYARGLANTISGKKAVFAFVPGVAGTYKVQAQTIANTSGALKPKNAADDVISRVISGTVSNTLGTFTVV
jgi:hypothetical protein